MTDKNASSAAVFVKRGRTKAVEMHHPWVYADAVERVEGDVAPGDLVDVRDGRGKFIAKGYANPRSRIAVKAFSWDEGDSIDRTFWESRLRASLDARRHLGWFDDARSALRLVSAEGDACPGLVVDRYASRLVVTFLTPGIARRAEMFVDLLREIASPAGIVERADAEVHRHEGIVREGGVLWGEAPAGEVDIVEGSAKFAVDLLGGHKSGFYLDQRENRVRIAELSRGRRVLDAFCYTGGFAIHAALGGATEVVGVDSSAPALELAERNAAANGVTVRFERGNAFERLRMLHLEGERFDMVVLDPPKLARGRSGVPKALRAHKDANLHALKLLNPGGLLFTCCCSGVITRADFLRALGDAAVDAGREVRVIGTCGAASDHPVSPACPETEYLQCLVVHVV